MRKVMAAASAALLMIGLAGSAHAASTTVQGTGSYKKLVVKNGTNKLIFKIHAPGGRCAIKYLAVKFRDRDGTKYTMDGGCYSGGTWAASLSRGTNLVECPRLTLKFNADKSVWTGTIPRGCLRQLAPAVKVTKSWVNDYSPKVNEVPATKYVKQG